MSEERRVQEQEEARHVLSPVRLAVLLLLGAFFLVLGGSRADAAEAGIAPADGPHLGAGTLAVLDAGPDLTPVGATVDGVVDPVLAAAEPVVQPVVEPVVRPVVEPVVTPVLPVVERVVTPLAALPTAELVAPVAAPADGPDRPATRVHRATEGGADTTADPAAAAVERTPPASGDVLADSGSGAPASGSPVLPASTDLDGGTGTTVPLAVLLTAFVAVLLLTGGIAPRRVAAPVAPTFLPPVFPG